jgi:hypothetical protein
MDGATRQFAFNEVIMLTIFDLLIDYVLCSESIWNCQ